MLLYTGHKSIQIGTEPIPEFICPYCSSSGTLELQIFSRHAHVYMLPLLPYTKIGMAHCTRCHNNFTISANDTEIYSHYLNKKGKYWPKWWQFSGVFVIAFFVCMLIFSSGVKDKQTKAFASAPEAGDVYYIKLENKRYTTFKILAIRAASMDVAFNNYEVDNSSGLDGYGTNKGIDKDENYKTVTRVPRNYIRDLDKGGNIIEIKRYGKPTYPL